MFEISTHPSISSIGRERWDSLNTSDYPFTRYDFLDALETSGSVSKTTGWQPLHLEIRRDDELVMFMPLYLKTHSYGEYVFDWSWAQAYERAGLSYYPKLLAAIPFTPATGPRWVTKLQSDEASELAAHALVNLCKEYQVETAHILFPKAQASSLKNAGLLQRKGCQYHWSNQDYTDFTHFLSTFNARKRKDVLKERRKSEDQQISFERFTAKDLTPEIIRIFYDFYVMTYLVRGQQPYLNQAFFQSLVDSMPEQMLLILARQDGDYIAGALSFKDSETLYGRYWGCTREFDGLHFETCYYQGLEYCIENGIKRFDPGAQGEHKIKRGFAPTATYSYHYVKDGRFRQAIENFVDEEASAINERIEMLSQHLPFKKSD